MVVKNPIQKILTFLVIVAACGGMLIVLGAFWESKDDLLENTSSHTFPARTFARLSNVIERTLNKSGIVETPPVTPVKKTLKQDTLNWTMYEYTVHLTSSSILSNIVYELSEAISTNGGEIFQTYVQLNKQKATLVIGVETFITHSIMFTWEVPPISKTPSSQPRSVDSSKYFKAAIVIDDLGANKHAVYRLLDLQEDFTFSILPHLKHSTEIAKILHEYQKEILLHLPMQPQGYPVKFPGKGTIMVNMSHNEIEQIIQQDLQTVPFVSGVNNHMGSLLTMDYQKMQSVLQVLRRYDLFFLDSRTTAKTVAYKVAQQLGIASAERKVFLDVIPQVNFVKNQLNELASLAEQGKPAIAIGHPKEATFQALKEMLPEFKRRNIKIVRVSQFMGIQDVSSKIIQDVSSKIK